VSHRAAGGSTSWGVVAQICANDLRVCVRLGTVGVPHCLTTEEVVMALTFLGKDPDSPAGDSPTIWDNGDSYIIQGCCAMRRSVVFPV
jgi:hypothetical protein